MKRPTPLAVTDTGIRLQPDFARVIARLFVAGLEEVGPGEARAGSVIQRVLDLSEREAEDGLAELDRRFAGRHRDLHAIFRAHSDMIVSRLDGGADQLSTARWLMLGASFTCEYSIEGAALCNPSIVAFGGTDRDGNAPFVMSVRGVGEGHRSSIGFRSGIVTADGEVRMDVAAPYPITGQIVPATHDRTVFHAKLAEFDDNRENAAFVLETLPEQFGDAQLAERIAALEADIATRRNTEDTVQRLREIAASSYTVDFPARTFISERVLWPQAPAESQGMEDARFVRFVDDTGAVTYFATYTAFDGVHIMQHMLRTKDFRTFHAVPLAGPAAVGKGLALFPRKVGGRYVALSRSDRESNTVAFSDDMIHWDDAVQLQTPTLPWELLQLGNCGSPIETEHGWLVLTHGVGAMRTYAIGALLLDLHRPDVVLARTVQPIITPAADERDGYVPNVVYSCGGFAHGDTLVVPYGIADHSIAIATMSVTALVASMRPG